MQTRVVAPESGATRVIDGGEIREGSLRMHCRKTACQTIVAVRRDGKGKNAVFQDSHRVYAGKPDEAQALTEEFRQLL